MRELMAANDLDGAYERRNHRCRSARPATDHLYRSESEVVNRHFISLSPSSGTQCEFPGDILTAARSRSVDAIRLRERR